MKQQPSSLPDTPPPALENADIPTVASRLVEHAVSEELEKAATTGRLELPAGWARYTGHHEIGRGGMGRVVAAQDRQFRRQVALKLLRPEVNDPALRHRFFTEALVTGNLEHPGIPAVYERGTSPDGTPYYAMRLVGGRTLSEMLAQAGDLTARLKLLPILVQVARTLAYAHDQGVIHRDVKPENVVVGQHGETILLDWGIARIRGLSARATHDEPAPGAEPERTAYGAVMGTPAYMAPEQANGEVDRIDKATDVFALGALLYHLLSGRPPYAGMRLEQALLRAADAEFEPLSKVAAEAPKGLREVCEHAMSRDPSARYASAGQFADAVEAWVLNRVSSGGPDYARWSAVGFSLLVVMALVPMTLSVGHIVSSFHQQGPAAYVVSGVTLAGLFLAGMDWRTRGRSGLARLVLAFAGAAFLIGLIATCMGLERTLSIVAVMPPEEQRVILRVGVYESLGNLVTASIGAVLQLLAWGLLSLVSAAPKAGPVLQSS